MITTQNTEAHCIPTGFASTNNVYIFATNMKRGYYFFKITIFHIIATTATLYCHHRDKTEVYSISAILVVKTFKVSVVAEDFSKSGLSCTQQANGPCRLFLVLVILTKLVWSEWWDIGLILFSECLRTLIMSWSKNTQQPAILTSHLINNLMYRYWTIIISP